ncbi:hypothetical protein HBI56_034940 [Parastagonospora nodorum]|uniref:Uncharacterized protein n=1 Tax=Phaeosphaeria nodorum (strain SN15 / ATCC MYA-4574 / FGSC 10173) TaxID=321614 RepID=A0A7U2I0S0_PHANO|nr:hypothetical protein HBH56_022750 [Parastagonospora nodorum]QRC95611.1 hypothetical protein JI435_407610 [Parastagonospora nodorum SN15]KAH3937024.1 hypothetical protein HBH54_011710 [Parastagonospora nodorum]KAH3943968.1 hypothetical protein HBH53_165000 [Parastagonospora nodorum]KAH3967561.1 hypothetical protein HBH51_135160 [Parastagonospora nodorum]
MILRTLFSPMLANVHVHAAVFPSFLSSDSDQDRRPAKRTLPITCVIDFRICDGGAPVDMFLLPAPRRSLSSSRPLHSHPGSLIDRSSQASARKKPGGKKLSFF